jgi:hypothetical protein
MIRIISTMSWQNNSNHRAHHKAGKLNRGATRAPPNTGCEEEFEDNQRGYQNPYIEEEHATVSCFLIGSFSWLLIG